MRFAWAFDHNVPPAVENQIMQIAEAQGVEAIFTMEHHHLRDGVTTATAVAVQTKKIQVVMGVLSPFFRHPIEIGITAANLQRISGGRSGLNLGVGMPETLRRIGIPFEKPLTYMRETIDILKLLFAGERFAYSGDVFEIEKHHLSGDKVAMPPIYISAMGPKLLELAGEMADGVNLPLASSPEYIAEAVGHVEQGLAKAGRSRDEMTIVAEVLVEVGDGSDWSGVRRLLSFHFSSDYFKKVVSPSGVDVDFDTIRAAFIRRDFEEIEGLVTDEHIRTFAAVGAPASILARLQDYLDAGADVINLYTAGEADARLNTINGILAQAHETQTAG
ncbi:MAG TPA: LLM class flavin-dependent oxidoreductase [Anaerolineales bacterium]|jgi:5,10-methylenetetrahydromethanopterin reductase